MKTITVNWRTAGHKGSRLEIPKNLEELIKQGLAKHIIRLDMANGETYVSNWTVALKTITVLSQPKKTVRNPIWFMSKNTGSLFKHDRFGCLSTSVPVFL